MPRRYAFELFYPAARVADGLRAMARRLPTTRRKRTARRVEPPEGFDADALLESLTPDAPVFFHTALLFPADEHVRAFRSDWEDRDSEWDDEGNEYLPVGAIDVAVRTGARYALVTFAAVTSGMSDVFERSRGVWRQFDSLSRESGGLVALFRGAVPPGRAEYPVLPDGRQTVTLDYSDFVLEERELYWHIDVDRLAATVLRATGRAG